MDHTPANRQSPAQLGPATGADRAPDPLPTTVTRNRPRAGWRGAQPQLSSAQLIADGVSAELLTLWALRRASRGGIAKMGNHYFDRGFPMPSYLTQILDELTEGGLLSLAQEDWGLRRLSLTEAEALVLREMFARYLDGATPREIAEALNDRGQPAAGGGLWHPASVRRMLRSRHVTGIRVFRGEAFGEGDWPAIIDRGTWAEVQDRSAYRASAHAYRSSRFYVLRGLVVCKNCGTHMSGSRGRAPSYMCTRRNELGPTQCTRRIHAPMLEAFVTDAAVQLLTHLDVTGAPTVATALSEPDEAAIAADEHELIELKDMWNSRELSTREYRQMRKTVEDRITTLQRKTIVRPTVEMLAGLVGPNARARWDELVAQGEWQRLNAVLRFLFAAVIIDEHRGKSGTFDYSRIDIEPNPL